MNRIQFIGGFGSAFAEKLCSYNNKSKLLICGLHDFYSQVIGKQDYLRDIYNLNIKNIIEKILKEI